MSDNVIFEKYIDKAIELGASEGKIINPETVITATWVRLKCQYGCQCYNSNRCCPPLAPTEEQMGKILKSYSYALLVCFKGHEKVNEVVAGLEKEMLNDGYYKAFGFGAGPCLLCDTCNMDQCAFPSRARPSLSGCGVDVFATVKTNGCTIEIDLENPGEAPCYGLILIE